MASDSLAGEARELDSALGHFGGSRSAETKKKEEEQASEELREKKVLFFFFFSRDDSRHYFFSLLVAFFDPGKEQIKNLLFPGWLLKKKGSPFVKVRSTDCASICVCLCVASRSSLQHWKEACLRGVSEGGR